ncbi:MAG TPA: ABC transporter substrate-binding protein [Xanthobacteraceae bacterium]|nr:ABC transporter substrate-binding protein [Xanthobacteraceae bacterium]
MRTLAATLLLLLAAVSARADAPRRVVSFNLCADQLVVALADAGQIAALSPYAQDRHLSVVAERARAFPTLDWSAEGTVAFGPDLVLVGPNDRRETRRMLNQLNIPVADVALVTDIATARAQILTLAARLGHPERGEAMVRALDDARARLAALARPVAKTALVVERGGYVEGPQSLTATLLAEAGLRLPEGAPAGYGGYMSLEMLLVTRPDVLVLKDPPLQAEDQGALFFTHPAVAALYPADRRIALPTRYTLCGGPALIEALDYLADVLGRNSGRSDRRPLPGSERWRGRG